MCEKCNHPEIQHLPAEKEAKPIQKKLDITFLKGKSKNRKTPY